MKVRGRRAMKRVAITADRLVGPLARRVGVDTKGLYEYAFWRSKQLEEKSLGNEFYEFMFTDGVGVPRAFYSGKRILDIGCGPRGSLEWAHDAHERVGLDSLVERYRKLGIDRHAMTYVASGAEQIPYGDGHFDVVTSFNSLDHVDDVDASLDEMTRVLASGGRMIIVVDIHGQPTVAEPHVLPWDLGTRLEARFEIDEERHLEKRRGHDYLKNQERFDHDDVTDRYGALVLVATKR